MKRSFLVILAAVLLQSCGPVNKKNKSDANELSYRSADTAAGALSVALGLTGNIGRKELAVQIKLSNAESPALDIQEIIIATDEGLRSIPVAGFDHVLLSQGKDTTLSLKFNPLNNLKEYQVTGMTGIFKPGYVVSVLYKAPGKDSLTSLSLRLQSAKDDYMAYSRKYKKPLTGYSFYTRTDFNERQRKYLTLILKQAQHPPFVYLSEQEIAISGLNFRLKSYYLQDTLHGELFIVNHGDFPVKIIRDALDITAGSKSLPGEARVISIEKISGAQQNPDMMEKGDRVLIHFKKYLKIENPGKETLMLNLHNAFMLSGKKALFEQDVQLLPMQF
ncbi:MAG: hypothetical protein ACHQIM_10795 [Sphingobacteriales bacterium]